jgi:hypothetical protein
MSLAVEWLEEAERDLLSLPDWRLAAAIDAAVLRFAADGIGFLRHVNAADGTDEWRLYAPQVRRFYGLCEERWIRA